MAAAVVQAAWQPCACGWCYGGCWRAARPVAGKAGGAFDAVPHDAAGRRLAAKRWCGGGRGGEGRQANGGGKDQGPHVCDGVPT